MVHYGVAAVETGGKQMSTGHLHLDGSNPIAVSAEKKKAHPNGCAFFFLAEQEGFEPSVPFWGTHDFQSCPL